MIPTNYISLTICSGVESLGIMLKNKGEQKKNMQREEGGMIIWETGKLEGEEWETDFLPFIILKTKTKQINYIFETMCS